MSKRVKPFKKLKIGRFTTENEASEEVENKSRSHPDRNYFITKLAGIKSGKRNWMAYSLTDKKMLKKNPR